MVTPGCPSDFSRILDGFLASFPSGPFLFPTPFADALGAAWEDVTSSDLHMIRYFPRVSVCVCSEEVPTSESRCLNLGSDIGSPVLQDSLSWWESLQDLDQMMGSSGQEYVAYVPLILYATNFI